MNPILIKSTRSDSNNSLSTDSSCQQVQSQMIHIPVTHQVDRFILKGFTYRTLPKLTGPDSKHSINRHSSNLKVQIQKFSYTRLFRSTVSESKVNPFLTRIKATSSVTKKSGRPPISCRQILIQKFQVAPSMSIQLVQIKKLNLHPLSTSQQVQIQMNQLPDIYNVNSFKFKDSFTRQSSSQQIQIKKNSGIPTCMLLCSNIHVHHSYQVNVFKFMKIWRTENHAANRFIFKRIQYHTLMYSPNPDSKHSGNPLSPCQQIQILDIQVRYPHQFNRFRFKRFIYLTLIISRFSFKRLSNTTLIKQKDSDHRIV